MEIAIIQSTGKSTGRKANLSEEIFGIEPNDHAIYLDVKSYLANQRQGTHKSKQRNEIAGSSKKIKKQKPQKSKSLEKQVINPEIKFSDIDVDKDKYS